MAFIFDWGLIVVVVGHGCGFGECCYNTIITVLELLQYLVLRASESIYLVSGKGVAFHIISSQKQFPCFAHRDGAKSAQHNIFIGLVQH